MAVEFDLDDAESRHRARLELIVDLVEAIGMDDVTVIDLETVAPAVGASALRSGVLLVGDADRAERLRERFETRRSDETHAERLRRFDAMLDRIEETVS